MAKQQRRWVYSPKKAKKPKVSEDTKWMVIIKAQAIIDNHFKPNAIREVPPDYEWNYIVDIYGKWNRNYYYLISKYHCPGPNAISPSFEAKFTRLEYAGPNSYNLAFMRHNNKWAEVMVDLTLEDALQQIETNPYFQP